MADKRILAERFGGRTVTVIGAGVSNRPLVDLLVEAGATVSVRDRKERDQLGQAEGRPLADLWEQRGVKLILGEGYLNEIGKSVIFRTPGLRMDHPALTAAVARGALLTSEMQLFFELCPAKTIGVTGSDGKTTTTTLIARILEAAGHRVYLGGNIGKPLLPDVFAMTPEDFAVVELSSFQLHSMTVSPSVGVITNLAPNHLDYHRDMEEYVSAKWNLLRYQKPGDVAVLNFDNAYTRAAAPVTSAVPVFFSYPQAGEGNREASFSAGEAFPTVYERDGRICYGEEEVLALSDIRLPGRHNVENYMAAIGALHGLVPPDAIRRVAVSFGGVEHRIEFVRELDGVKYYNSSIDSSPSRTAAALAAFGNIPLTVLMGGYDKHIPYDPLGDPVCRHARQVILTGATADAIEAAIRRSPLYRAGTPEIYRVADYGAGVKLAQRLTHPGDVVILSPASASFDAFRNFEERGSYFKAQVNALR